MEDGASPGRRRFLSFGAGVQTTALLLIDKFDEVIFADTGSEWPETYAHIEAAVVPYCRDHGIPFTVVKATVPAEEQLIAAHMTPSMQYRWCTDRWKIRPIREHVKANYSPLPATAVIGFSLDEAHRMHKPHWPEYVNEYPLVDRRLTRSDCIRIIEGHGWKVPPKSGCYFCPFQSGSKWRELFYSHPGLYDRAVSIEENGSRFPEFTLRGNGTSLRDQRKLYTAPKGSRQSRLDGDDIPQDECTGGCFT